MKRQMNHMRFVATVMLMFVAMVAWSEPDGSNVLSFIKMKRLADVSASVFVADDILVSDKIRIACRGEEITAPYERFRFVFVDDCPGANWAHPCRYIFVSEDFMSFTVLHRRWIPRLVIRDTGEGVLLQKVGKAVDRSFNAMDDIKRSVYGYAKRLGSQKSLYYNAGDSDKSYFVLISGGSNPYLNGIRFWSDTAMMYSTLTLKYGVPKGNIHVYMSDGKSTDKDANLDNNQYALVDSPRDLDGDGSADVTGAATKSNVRDCFSRLRAQLSSDNQLFVFITGNGDVVGDINPANRNSVVDMFTMEREGYYYKDAETVSDKELASWTRGFACPVAFAIQPSYSGGFIDDLIASPNRVVATSCNHYEQSWGVGGHGKWYSKYGQTGAYDYWSAPFIAAFRGCRPYSYGDYGYPWADLEYDAVNADVNGDGKVSFNEARIYAANTDSYYNEHPQYGENPKGLGSSFYIIKPSVAPQLFAAGMKDAPFMGNATYEGWLRNKDGSLAGMITVKAGKPGKAQRVKVDVSYVPLSGKKQTIKLTADAMPVAGKVSTVTLLGIGSVKLTGDAIKGVNVDLQVGKDLVKAKDGVAMSKMAQKAGAWAFAFDTGSGYAAFSVVVDKKGKGKLSGTLPDGTKVTAKSQGILGGDAMALPFVCTKKCSLGFVLWVKDGGKVTLSDITALRSGNGTASIARPVSPTSVGNLVDGDHTFKASGISQKFKVSGSKWSTPKSDKKAAVNPNPTGLKLKFTAKTGMVKGSLTSGKMKLTVVGAVVGGRFFGSVFGKGATPRSATAE